ncbi:CubicO group peptidase (beta-lactamase class C family) [Flavobacterium sp. 270]|uniref:serine hydrolase domain-containing protein n=1 Tax=Flavobacterium sp. 270 TaxID=2512114 RepID=UPI001065C57F|nr:serine hydrolase domain-containing protein [Flavobacterium sp. 270]TDW48093.1 CubicO group peptidase (beta-lactamase class C family) [Flavobacterium sp. 270]
MKQRLSLLLLFITSISFAQKELIEKLENYMNAEATINNFGGTVLITKKDSVLLKKNYGLADYEWQVKNTIDTKFSLASVTKQFTATAILQLEENKKLSLDDKLSHYFPDFPNGEKITLRMLLTHNSGLDMDYDELYRSKTTLDENSVYNYIKQKPFLFEPGTNTAYSNIGYYLLARIIEKLSNESYAIYLKKNIFDKAGMKNTGISSNDSIVQKLAKTYYFKDHKLIKNPYINWNFNIGHDGIYSTVEDLYLWNKALFDSNIILSETSKKKMFTSYNKENFGLGFMINPFYNHGHELIAHDGGFYGTVTSFNKFTKDDIFITVLSNNQSPSHFIAYGLAGICFGKEVEIPYQHHQIKIDTVVYDQYIGEYESIQILKKDNKLYYKDFDIELFPESKTKFFRSDDNGRTVEFIQNKKGKTIQIIITKAGVKETKNKTK